MSAHATPAELKGALRRTWSAFFARHGNFTPVQIEAIPPILRGENTLIMAATAAGKTEAAMAPLVERLLIHPRDEKTTAKLRILYISPTRALVRDLYERLRLPLASLNVSLAMKSGDTGPLWNLPTVLITTPESTDSLLTRWARSFTGLQAVVLDEIHLLDGGPRGDHVRCLLKRIEIIREYHRRQQGEPDAPPLQRIALSATVDDPAGVAERYLAVQEGEATPVEGSARTPPAHGDVRAERPTEQRRHTRPAIIDVPGRRGLEADILPVSGMEEIAQALLARAWGDPPARKSLLFCNTRREVELTAANLRQHLGYESAIFVHYSNLDPAMRRTVEEDFAQAATAICVATSTLELGIDIGSIDDVVLLGPPRSLGSFLQRIGRGNRRSNRSRVLCLARDALEEVQFRAMVSLAEDGHSATSASEDGARGHFRPSVLIQQVFSLLKQSPTGSVRLADLRRVSPVDLDDATLRAILDELDDLDYLRKGRPGEWRPGGEFDLLLDAHEIYSNIGSDPLSVLVVDAYTMRTMARLERSQVRGPTLQLVGKTWSVVWRDRYRIGVSVGGPGVPDESYMVKTAPMTVSLAMGQAVAAHYDIQPATLPMVQDIHGVWLCHFWGDLYGRWLAALLQGEGSPSTGRPVNHVEIINEHVLYVHGRIRRLPPWDQIAAMRHLRVLAPGAIPYLNLGRFHSLLPPTLAWQTVLDACDLPCFERLYRAGRLETASADLADRLRVLLW